MAKVPVEIKQETILKIGDKEIKLSDDEAYQIYLELKKKYDNNIGIVRYPWVIDPAPWHKPIITYTGTSEYIYKCKTK
jgi:hypothetical protein